LNRSCVNNTQKGTASCCWTDFFSGDTLCQTCDINTDTGDFVDCTEPHVVSSKTDSSTIVPPTSGIAPPPPTESCPENIARDAQGNCTPLTQTPETPVPKSGLGNLLPEGVFEGPTSPEEVPQGAPPTAEDGSEQPPNQPLCPEGQVLDEDLGFCVPTECPEGQELNEETGICVLEEQLAADEEPEEQQQTEGEQPSEESGSEEDNGNN
jgi:hypothetical protein